MEFLNLWPRKEFLTYILIEVYEKVQSVDLENLNFPLFL